jgi:hypothetical protein
LNKQKNLFQNLKAKWRPRLDSYPRKGHDMGKHDEETIWLFICQLLFGIKNEMNHPHQVIYHHQNGLV